MFAEAFESVKRRYFGSSAPPRPGAGGGETDGPEPETDVDGPPHRLTPNEEILQLLEAHDGRINQGQIVEALEWSPATVSRRLGQLEADDRVVRFPVGRRKIVCLPDCRPAAARSPFEA